MADGAALRHKQGSAVGTPQMQAGHRQVVHRCLIATGHRQDRRTACALLSTTVDPSDRNPNRPRLLPRPNSSGAPPPMRSQATCARVSCRPLTH